MKLLSRAVHNDEYSVLNDSMRFVTLVQCGRRAWVQTPAQVLLRLQADGISITRLQLPPPSPFIFLFSHSVSLTGLFLRQPWLNEGWEPWSTPPHSWTLHKKTIPGVRFSSTDEGMRQGNSGTFSRRLCTYKTTPCYTVEVSLHSTLHRRERATAALFNSDCRMRKWGIYSLGVRHTLKKHMMILMSIM